MKITIIKSVCISIILFLVAWGIFGHNYTSAVSDYWFREGTSIRIGCAPAYPTIAVLIVFGFWTFIGFSKKKN